MRIAVIGAAGMIGHELTRELVTTDRINGQKIEQLILSDIRPVDTKTDETHITEVIGDAADSRVVETILTARPDVIFHVAATAMGQADRDFAIGYHINFDTVRTLAEGLRLAGESLCPRLVHASSIGVFGGPFPAVIEDHHTPCPDSSYGAQKLMSETLIADYSRMGFLDGICLRLPTIAIRPGAATHGNSGFFSNIIREPLHNKDAILPASDNVRHWLASPKTAVAQLIHAATLPSADIDGSRALTMPGISVTVAELLDALKAEAGKHALSRVKRQLPPLYQAEDFPQRFATSRAHALGFPCLEQTASDLINDYLATSHVQQNPDR
ncbi:NAD-dependent epimerase/dehydratase family protein [Martelella alba]|uniref:NAD-dependent epimerase/dehydratase family protein n=1 Tax=Martelella alba TaxID=2590451 RepID=A0A506UIM8_9HYPH|nr:NAD-dependent epimerase/dehydratase family protein [Martelella alba]TPW33191.1 NAD-dependent epimerase/dehydratase family protein [Martelella alba]